MAKETNKYAQRRKQAREYFYFVHFIYKILGKCKKILHYLNKKVWFYMYHIFTLVYQNTSVFYNSDSCLAIYKLFYH